MFSTIFFVIYLFSIIKVCNIICVVFKGSELFVTLKKLLIMIFSC